MNTRTIKPFETTFPIKGGGYHPPPLANRHFLTDFDQWGLIRTGLGSSTRGTKIFRKFRKNDVFMTSYVPQNDVFLEKGLPNRHFLTDFDQWGLIRTVLGNSRRGTKNNWKFRKNDVIWRQKVIQTRKWRHNDVIFSTFSIFLCTSSRVSQDGSNEP